MIYNLRKLLCILLFITGCTTSQKNQNSLVAEKESDCIVKTSTEYSENFHVKKRCRIRGLVGRVLRGKSEKDFEFLSDDPNRKIIFLMDGVGLESIVGLNLDQILVKIGYSSEYINTLKADQYQFKLVVFIEDQGSVPATWENIVSIVDRVYGQNIGTIIETHLSAFRSKSFSEIESQAPTQFKTVSKIGSSHREYITENKLLEDPSSTWKARAFLYYNLRLTELFTGNGLTKTIDDNGSVPEYITENKKLSELPNMILVPLN